MFRLATPADLPAVAAVYEAILDREEATGVVYTNWKRGVYPSPDSARQVLESGTLYVGEEDGGIWGSVNLNGVQLPEYAAIPWSIPAENDRIAVIHTLTVHPAQAGRGLARQMVDFCQKTARAQGKTVIRLDTWEGNLPANRLYPGLGYRFAGSAEFLFMGFVRETLNCYEKAL